MCMHMHVHTLLVQYNTNVYILCVYNYTFERNHRLVNAILRMRTVCCQKPLLQLGDHWKHLLQSVIAWLIPRRQSCVVSEVQVLRYLLKPVSSDAGGDERVVEFLIPGPVVPNLGQPVHPHHKA